MASPTLRLRTTSVGWLELYGVALDQAIDSQPAALDAPGSVGGGDSLAILAVLLAYPLSALESLTLNDLRAAMQGPWERIFGLLARVEAVGPA